MRHGGDDFIVTVGVEFDDARTDVLCERAGGVKGFFGGACRAGEDKNFVLIQCGVRRIETGSLFATHGMPADGSQTFGQLIQRIDNSAFGRAHVQNQRAVPRDFGEMRNLFQDGANGSGEDDNVRVACRIQLVTCRINCPARQRVIERGAGACDA